VAGPLLLTAAHGTTATIAAGVYAASVTGMFAASALYHRISWQPMARRWMQRLDHAMIFILIAGTYTPVLLLRMPTPHDIVGLCACGVQTLSQGRDLGIGRSLRDGGVLRMNAFK
jgi:hemolysin III